LIQDDHAVRARTPQAGCKIGDSAIEHQTAFDPPKPACIIRSFIGDLTRSTCSTSFATTEPLQNDHYSTDQIGSPRQLSSPKISFGQLFLFECFFDKLNFLFVGQIFIHDSYWLGVLLLNGRVLNSRASPIEKIATQRNWCFTKLHNALTNWQNVHKISIARRS
jgi:hypothetical protein